MAEDINKDWYERDNTYALLPVSILAKPLKWASRSTYTANYVFCDLRHCEGWHLSKTI